MKPLRFDVWVVVTDEHGQRVGAYRDAIDTIEVYAEPDKVVSAALAVLSEVFDETRNEFYESRSTVLLTDERGPRLFEFARGVTFQFRRVD